MDNNRKEEQRPSKATASRQPSIIKTTTTVSIQKEVADIMDKRRDQMGKSRAAYVRDLILDDAAPRLTHQHQAVNHEELYDIAYRLAPEGWTFGSLREDVKQNGGLPSTLVRLDTGSSIAIVHADDIIRFSNDLRKISKDGGRAVLKSMCKDSVSLFARRQGSAVVLETGKQGEGKIPSTMVAASNIEVLARFFEYTATLAKNTKENDIDQ